MRDGSIEHFPRALPDVLCRRPRRVPVTLHLYPRFRPSTVVHRELLGRAAAVLQAGPVLVDVPQRRRVLRVLFSKSRSAVGGPDLADVAAAMNQARLLQGG